MTGITASNKKSLVLVSGRAHPALAEAVASELGTELVTTEGRTFANGELYVRYGESVRGGDVFVLQSHTSAESPIISRSNIDYTSTLSTEMRMKNWSYQ